MLARLIANREDPDQTLGRHCLSWPFRQATSVGNFGTPNSIVTLVYCCEFKSKAFGAVFLFSGLLFCSLVFSCKHTKACKTGPVACQSSIQW